MSLNVALSIWDVLVELPRSAVSHLGNGFLLIVSLNLGISGVGLQFKASCVWPKTSVQGNLVCCSSILMSSLTDCIPRSINECEMGEFGTERFGSMFQYANISRRARLRVIVLAPSLIIIRGAENTAIHLSSISRATFLPVSFEIPRIMR